VGHVEKVDRTLPFKMIFYIRRDAGAQTGPADVLGYAPTLA